MNPNDEKKPCPLTKAHCCFVKLAGYLRCPLLLAMRLYWGWSFFQTGKGKLMHLDRTTGYFESIHIPMPHLNAILAGSTECFGGLLLLLGLGSRIACVPLIFTMVIAYATTEMDAVKAIFSDPDKFVSAAPFQFMFVCFIVLAFGPGRLSLDALLCRKKCGADSSCSPSCCAK